MGSLDVLGRSWAVLRASWAVLGDPEVALADLGGPAGALGKSWASVGVS